MGRRKKIVHGEKKLPSLPWELIEEILSRVPPQSLGLFRIVSKKWNTLFDDKTFLNNHKSTFRFVLRTTSKLYSVSIDPKVVVRELTLDIPNTSERLVDCGEFLLCCMGYRGSAVWNPWLKQAKMIKSESYLRIEHGIGYESHVGVKESGYMTIGSDPDEYGNTNPWKIHDFATGAWEELKLGYVDSSGGSKRAMLCTRNGVSCNGNLYWVAYYNKTDPLYHLREFEFSSQRRSAFVAKAMPCNKED
ncbi:hypothetical protein AALP_AA3G355700 [Arabis alpina]|uniref:F-box domain-containing protein n=1 Tax=Arabis alpina TaxID=50452 RepID=A0A087HDT5_ARAAL|nr:hypothetical protein AALP_AA3G355700 [Arabis alpina]